MYIHTVYCICVYIYIYIYLERDILVCHRHRNLKAFEEHIQKHVSDCFVTEQNLSW